MLVSDLFTTLVAAAGYNPGLQSINNGTDPVRSFREQSIAFFSNPELLESTERSARIYLRHRAYLADMQRNFQAGHMTAFTFTESTKYQQGWKHNAAATVSDLLSEICKRVEQDGPEQHPEFVPLVRRLRAVSAAAMENADLLIDCVLAAPQDNRAAPRPVAMAAALS